MRMILKEPIKLSRSEECPHEKTVVNHLMIRISRSQFLIVPKCGPTDNSKIQVFLHYTLRGKMLDFMRKQ